ncbi:MAG: LysM peptidoglycan-binding domain-containing protein [Anaerolineales bacterium]|nr:LysM peptidoglycan-binding domain-containing protein [Anaerolineales bacterium]
MCGCLLDEAHPQEETTPQRPSRRGLPGWAQGVAAAALALVILVAGGYWLFRTMNRPPAPVTPTVAPSATPTRTPSPTPTLEPTVTPTPTPLPPRSHQVEAEETLIEIAVEYGVSTDDILALNPDLEPEFLQVGQVLLIPPDPDAAVSAGDGTPTSGDFLIHIVQPGEALLAIAEKYEVSVESIRAANDMEPYESDIQANQSLVIPINTPTPTPTPTLDPRSTPTPLPPYRAPNLLAPIDGALFVVGDRPVVLQWAAVALLDSDEWYAVHLSQRAGSIAETHYTRSTSWRLPESLLEGASTEAREFGWSVQVVREQAGGDGSSTYQRAGEASAQRSFIWVDPTPTPTLPPTASE